MRTLDDFEGHWTISRHIEDARARQTGTLTGTCTFTRTDTGLLQTETGTLTLAGTSFEATRRYLWHSDGDLIAVHFDDGRFFHHVDPAATNPTAGHDCAPDRYDVTYDFSRWPMWQSRWHVAGPRKDYVSTTTFENSR
ncbi:DUF6314 family protein [Celeribacter arenosi]|uniref:DUF6314 domain-containing protein n=1 Tax=Celeribacter arenosi TaxID=792649 RepID=A0ABP7KDW6_9RHOB